MQFIKVAFDASMESSWVTLTAKSGSTLATLMESPSTGERNFDFKEGVTTAILSHFRGSLETCFDEHAHGDSFWDNILLQVKCSFAASLISYRLGPKEADVVNGLLLPMLRTLIRSVAILPNAGSDCPSFRAHLLTGDAIPKAARGPGRNPEIDIVVQLMDEHARSLSLMPMEAKSVLKTKHIAQLCTYMFRLASTDEFFGKTIVGFLIDSSHIRLCIGCTVVDGVMVPTFQVSPPMLWRSEDGTSVVVETLAIVTSCIFYMKLLPLNVPDAEEYMKQIGHANRAAKMVIHPPTPLSASVQEIVSRLDVHERSIEELAQQVRSGNPHLAPDFGSPSKKRRHH